MEIAFLVLRILLAAVLYAFLVWALYLLWSRLRQQSQTMEAAPVPGISLRLLHADLMLDAEKSFHFSRKEVIIGRQPGSDVRLDDGTISARHARLVYHHAQWWLEDLDSRNGTHVNELTVEEPLVVTYGDVITMGRVEFRLEVGAEIEEHQNKNANRTGRQEDAG